MPRMKILNSVERVVFDFPPIFNSVERKRCFDFPTPLQDVLRTASNQLVFLLSCGYFKATELSDSTRSGPSIDATSRTSPMGGRCDRGD
jgi:hypothetical protein